jgi:phosphate-selective porin OprO/OprP
VNRTASSSPSASLAWPRRVAQLLTLSLCLGAATARAQDPAPPTAGTEAAPAAPAAPAEGAAPAAASAPPTDLAALQARIEEINQRALIAERKVELIEEDAAKTKATAPVVSASEKGFNWKSPDGAFVVKVRGYIHADAREYHGPNDIDQRNTFLIRRARPVLEATFFDVADFRLMPDFGGGATVLYDAYIDLRPFPWLKLRAGKFKPPVGLERLQSATAIVFPERALPTALVPNRDVGLQLHGVIGPQIFTYELGLFNGVVDGSLGDLDNNYAKDTVGRLFFTPLKNDPYSVFANLGFGFGASIGGQRGTPAVFAGTPPARTANSTPGLPSFRSPGQLAFFSYLVNDNAPDATVIGRGRRTRLAPQAYYYYESFGLLGEWVQSSQQVIKGANVATLDNRAWQVQAGYVIGGKNAFEGVTVTDPLSPKTGGLGALEIAARYNELKVDDDAFPLYASLSASAKKAQAFGVVLNWHWSRNIKIVAAYEHTKFTGGAAANGNRANEDVFIQRVQAAF